MPPVALRFATDDDMLRREPGIDSGNGRGSFPRVDKDGRFLRSWDSFHALAMEDLERRLRNHRGTGERFELGQLGHRSREQMREFCACMALHYLFVASDTVGDNVGVAARKAAYYATEADNVFTAEMTQLDYDENNSGVIDASEQDRPFPGLVIRG